MIKYLLPLMLALCPAARAAGDCAKNSDACVGTKTASPFAAASLREPLPPAPPGSGGTKAVVRQAAPAAAAPEAAPAPEPEAAPQAKPVGEQLGSPLWLLFVGGVLAALYFYLGAGRKKGRRK